MKRLKNYKTQIVQSIPEELEKGILYVCVNYDICAHLCACGCKSKIFTPISKEYGWVISYDGVNASLTPSIGNGAYPCASHYFLKEGKVHWLPPITTCRKNIERSKKNKIKEKIKKLFNRYLSG